MSGTNVRDLYTIPFSFTYKSWGTVRVKHLLNFNGDPELVRLQVLEGPDKGGSFVVPRAAMLEAIAKEA